MGAGEVKKYEHQFVVVDNLPLQVSIHILAANCPRQDPMCREVLTSIHCCIAVALLSFSEEQPPSPGSLN